MTRIIATLLLLLALGCSGEFVTSQETDLMKYPEITVFIQEMDRFQGDVSDLESSVFRFSYASRQIEPLMVLRTIDKEAVAEGWRITSDTGMTHVYKKNLHRYKAQTRDDVVLVTYDGEKKVFHIEWM